MESTVGAMERQTSVPKYEQLDRHIYLKKLQRLREGATPRVIDLFSGCGGLSLGFHAAGYEIVAGVEYDPLAARSHAENFHQGASSALLELHARHRDITALDPEQFVAELNLGADPEDVVDVLVGGPPCQAFARVGRAKLREVAEHPEAFRQDPRGNLYLRYLDYVRRLKPLALLMENVPDVLNYGGHNIAQEMCEVLADMGYECRYTLLNASFYGVPQMRERMFLLAYATELGQEPTFPAPTHWVDLPRGYEGTRQVALKHIGLTLPTMSTPYFVPPPTPSRALPPAITAREALGDLPPITLHLKGHLKRGARRFDEKIHYPHEAQVSRFARLMRNWPGFEGNDGVSDHVIRSLPRDYVIFRRMNPGDQYPQAYRHAETLLREYLEISARSGRPILPDTQEYTQAREAIVPPYDPTKFPNKWRKMESDRPARTLMAHLGKDGYSHIHYDSTQARTISVREAARLQSFPDGFHFSGTMNPAFRQIGNAVPPLLANRLACVISEALRVQPVIQPLVGRL